MKKIVSSALLLTLVGALFESPVQAGGNYHTVGWFNTFVPGGGEFLLGNPGLGAFQAVTEISTFGWGYQLYARSPLTLDGVPEDIPSPRLTKKKVETRGQYCALHPKDAICLTGKPSDPILVSSFDRSPLNIQRSLSADILQEIGLKYHMVNVYNAYRESGAPNVDKTPTGELFLAPFRWSVLKEPIVYIPIAVSAAVLAASYYFTAKDGLSPGPKLTKGSNRLYAATYGLVFPVGSAVPEEMFYRGFLQNEAYSLVASPWFSVPTAALAYTLSHAPADMPTAAITALWLGTVTHLNHGLLSKGIAYHFWADVLAGMLAIQLIQKSEFYAASTDIFNFKWSF